MLEMTQIIFTHANSFPASTYRFLFERLRKAGIRVEAIECIGHDPSYPVTSNWPMLVEQVKDFVLARSEHSREPLWLVGHSLGGYLSMMCAASHPLLARSQLRGVIVLDAPIIGGWKARGLRLIKRSPLVGALLPGRLSRKRRRFWPDTHAVFEHFKPKRAFRRWHPAMLQDYVECGTRDAVDRSGKPCRELVFDRDIETAIYNSVPDHLENFFKRQAIRCKIYYVGGKQSLEAKRIGLTSTLKLIANHPQGKYIEVEGSHLFPMEQPEATVELLISLLSE